MPTCARCSACSGSRTCSTPRPRAPTTRRARWSSSASGRARRNFAEADRLRDELAARGWEVRDGPEGPELVPPGGDRLRAQPRARGAAGPRRVSRVWATKGAAREPWLAGVEVARVASGEEIAARCGSDAHQGVCAEVSDYRYADASELLALPDPLLVALDEIQDPQNLGAICRSAEGAGATGIVIPERRAATVTAAVCAASAGAVEHLPVARVRNLADFLAEAKAAGCWCYGAAAGRAGGVSLARTTRAAWSWSAPRGRACAQGRRRLRPARIAASAREGWLAERERRGGGAAVRDLAAPGRP